MIYTGWICKNDEEKNNVLTDKCSKSLWKTSLTGLRSRWKDDITLEIKVRGRDSAKFKEASQNPVKLRDSVDSTSTI